METVARRIAQIVEAYSGEWRQTTLGGVHHYEGRTSAMDCIDPNLRAAGAKKTRGELDLENLRGKFTGATGAGRQGGAATGAGDGADGEGTFAAKGGGPPKTAGSRPGGSDAMTVSQASGEGTTAGRIKSLKDGYGVVLDAIFPLPLTRELGPRPQGRKQVRAGYVTRDARRT